MAEEVELDINLNVQSFHSSEQELIVREIPLNANNSAGRAQQGKVLPQQKLSNWSDELISFNLL